METIFGCECNNCRVHKSHNRIPCAFLVEREGKQIKVCTKCDLSTDKYIARLFDGDSNMKDFFDYDNLGTIVILNLLDEKYWKSYQ